MAKDLLIASTSTVYGSSYLEYLLPELALHFKNIDELLFIPYARPGGIDYVTYTDRVQKSLASLNIKVVGIHTFDNPKKAIINAQAIFTGGGNTFELVNQLYKNEVLPTLRVALFNGTPYLGTSAGSNICGLTMQTTNDMPIVYPPSFKTLGMLPFNINPHYLDPIPDLNHMGETREQRIKEYHTLNTVPVVGLREGSWLEVKGEKITLKGPFSARIFEAKKQPFEMESGSVMDL